MNQAEVLFNKNMKTIGAFKTLLGFFLIIFSSFTEQTETLLTGSNMIIRRIHLLVVSFSHGDEKQKQQM